MTAPFRRLLLISLCLLVGLASLEAREPRPAVAPIRHMGVDGTLILAPGNPHAEVVQRFVEFAGKDKARVVIVAFDRRAPAVTELRQQLIAAKVEKPITITPMEALKGMALNEATGVWVLNLDKLPPGTETRLQSYLSPGHVLAISGSGVEHVGASRWNLLPGSLVTCDTCSDAPSKALTVQLTKSPGLFGLAIESSSDSNPAVIVQGREIKQLGTGRIRFMLAASSTRPVRVEALNPTGVEDLTLWRRAAIARTQEPFPIEKPAPPIVKHGSLVIVGGGGMPEDVSKKFIELAGGPDAPIVVLPTSMPDPLPLDGGSSFFKRFGATKVTTINARKKEDVESAENLKALREAKAIWFGGGRQWRFVDAYEGTAAYELIHDVLQRGGVIGGSSAGATIQGDYLVRGSPHGPQFMMCEGYERGFNFLPGTAIDQHFAQRKRFVDMTALMKVYPQYLGIGLDEATAIVVQGQIATVMGRGQVHLYDRRLPVPQEGNDYQSFKSGTRLDLVARKELDQ
jgi:cyanophycinase